MPRVDVSLVFGLEGGGGWVRRGRVLLNNTTQHKEPKQGLETYSRYQRQCPRISCPARPPNQPSSPLLFLICLGPHEKQVPRPPSSALISTP